MIKQSVSPPNELDLSAKYADLCARYEHLANYKADVESQLIRERADRENLLEKDVLARLAVEKKHLLEENASKEAELAARQRSIEECERRFLENLQRKEQEISMRIQAEVELKLEAVRNDAQHKLIEMIRHFLLALKKVQSGDTLQMQQCLDGYAQKAEAAEKAYTEEIKQILDSSVHKQMKKNRQCEKLVRMLFTRKSEKWNPDEDEKKTIEQRISAAVELSDQEKSDYADCKAKLKEYRQRIEAPAFEGPIWKNDASAELLSEIEVNKYYYHLPFYRQLKMMAMGGYPQSKSTLDGWHQAACELLKPLYELQNTTKRLLLRSFQMVRCMYSLSSATI